MPNFLSWLTFPFIGASMFKDYLLLLRPWQWTKNLFVFLPLFFALQIANMCLLARAVEAFLLVCLLARGIYIFNDYHDRHEDRIHPRKKKRPLASGRIQAAPALLLGGILISAACLGAAAINIFLFYLFLFYVALNVAYTMRLKHLAIIDIMIISTGFVLRVFIGGIVTGIEVYPWIIVMTFLLSLFLAFGKRRDDVLYLESDGIMARKSIDGYSLKFIDCSMMITAAVTIVSYIMYTMSLEITAKFNTSHLYLTSFFVIAGIFRYLQITIVEQKEADPSMVILRDHFIQMTIMGWILVFGLLIYIQ